MTAQSPIQWETVGSRGRKPREGEVQPHLCQKCQRSSAEGAEFKGAEWAGSKGQAAGAKGQAAGAKGKPFKQGSESGAELAGVEGENPEDG